MKNKYSCFLHANVGDYEEKFLSDCCPKCQLPYGFPITEAFSPEKIGEYKIIRPLGRGYYGATYIAEKSNTIRNKKYTIKIIPKATYKKFNKDFYRECKVHLDAADQAEHIVNIEDAMDAQIEFRNGTVIDCHVAILDYIEGITLESFLFSSCTISMHTIVQIAIDCLKILEELSIKSIYHNDLHLSNLLISTSLSKGQYRTGEIDPEIKVSAIDFGSSSGKSQSDEKNRRLGDLHWIAKILDILSKRILDSPIKNEERDFRLALLLEERAKNIFPNVSNQRTFSFDEVINQIRQAYVQVTSPWKEPLQLRSFNDSYNAQTLSPWFVPFLLVDDEDKWISEISSKGPQVITGMRGCGKTMLLRSLQFHARATPQSENEKKDINLLIDRLNNDNYIGIYVSCTRLLDSLGLHDNLLNSPFERLFIAYAIETFNALRHLRELSPQLVKPNAFKIILDVVQSTINYGDDLSSYKSEFEIEGLLLKILNEFNKGERKFNISANPALVFTELAAAIRSTTLNWSNAYVMFLLDDVSTRFLNDANIINLVSSLLFQSEICAFKFTTEAQTLEMVIYSPGNIEQARVGRDLQVFDLGFEVNNKIHSSKSEGTSFVEKILYKRTLYHAGHPNNIMPKDLLGDETLQNIALSISKEGKASSKKGIYHGMTAIAGVCVGDIGDIITLYEKILKKRKSNTLPISSETQNEAYLELCNSRIFDINRKSTKLFDFAESFAEAAHHLLIQSYKKNKNQRNPRLRQYSSIFINISAGDVDSQNQQIRELIDAGIFNFSGGPQASRTNRQGANPQQQYKLTFRKIYGLTKHIGLSQSDRFELSGEALENWLNNPKNGKDILIRNLAKDAEYLEEDSLNYGVQSSKSQKGFQTNLFTEIEGQIEQAIIYLEPNSTLIKKLPQIEEKKLTKDNLEGISEYITSFGFEDATLSSLTNILSLKPIPSIIVEFEEEGKKCEIKEFLKIHNLAFTRISYTDLRSGEIRLSPQGLIDITGIPQSLIFDLVIKGLEINQEVHIAFTKAKQLYPLDRDIGSLLANSASQDKTTFLKSINNILKGEEGPYTIIPLLPIETNHAQRRVLIAFANSKHERLYTLLDRREFDKIIIIVPKGNSPKEKLAKIAAEIALTRYTSSELHEVDEYSLQDTVEFLTEQFEKYFLIQNFSFEIALSGNKIQALASAVVSQSLKINQCWYIQPNKWDTRRFTKGALSTKIYTITKNGKQ